MTLVHEKMTLFLTETPVSVSDWLEFVVSLPGFGGLLHSYKGGSAGTTGWSTCRKRRAVFRIGITPAR